MWVSNKSPDEMFEVSYPTLITPHRFGEKRRDIIKRTNRKIQYVKDHRVSIAFPKLDLATLWVINYLDTSFSSNYDLKSQLCYNMLLANGTGRRIPIFFRSYKALRVSRSALDADLIPFSYIFDAYFRLAEELR